MWSCTKGALARAIDGMRPAALSATLLLLCDGAVAAGPDKLCFEHVSIEQGLSQESVLTILPDRQGFMWFGTQAGLARFDAATGKFVRYRLGAHRSVNAIVADRHGMLWLGTGEGLVRLDPASGAGTTIGGVAEGAAVTALAFDGQGVLWAGTGCGVARRARPCSR